MTFGLKRHKIISCSFFNFLPKIHVFYKNKGIAKYEMYYELPLLDLDTDISNIRDDSDVHGTYLPEGDSSNLESSSEDKEGPEDVVGCGGMSEEVNLTI